MRPVVLAVVAGALLLAGCSGGGDPVETTTIVAPTSAPTASPSATDAPLEPGNVYVDTVNSQAEGEFVGAATDVTEQSCDAGDGTWVGSGTLTNPTDEAVDYRVWVAFIGPDGDTVGLVQSNADGVEGGESGGYSASMPYTEEDALTCVLRVERRAAA
jgi:hypothetical protein